MTTVSPVLTLKQMCAYLQCGRSYLLKHADEIGCIRTSGKLRFLREDADNWLLRHRVQTPAAQPTQIAAARQQRQARPVAPGVGGVTGKPRGFYDQLAREAGR